MMRRRRDARPPHPQDYYKLHGRCPTSESPPRVGGREPEEVETACRDAAAAGREAAVPAGLVLTAQSLFALGNALAVWGREPEEVETAYRDAAAAGREAASPEGLLLTAQSLSMLGLVFAGWGRPQQEVETAYRDAAAAGGEAAEAARESATPECAVVVELVSSLLREPSRRYTQ